MHQFNIKIKIECVKTLKENVQLILYVDNAFVWIIDKRYSMLISSIFYLYLLIGVFFCVCFHVASKRELLFHYII